MKTFKNCVSRGWLAQLLAAAALAAPWHSARAQSFCASDGQAQPVALLERFISADCASCWQDPATPRARAHQVALDWVLPGNQGDAAPLSAVASRDGLERLQALGKTPPTESSASSHPVRGLPGTRLRVAHGLAMSGYIGASIELKPLPVSARQQVWSAWLALVESLPEGTEGTPVARNLVKNVLQVNWDGRKQLSKKEQARFLESRVMSVASGVHAERLRVIGWVEDAHGQVLVAAESRCAPVPGASR